MSPRVTMGAGFRSDKKAGTCVLSRAGSDDTIEVKCAFMTSAVFSEEISIPVM